MLRNKHIPIYLLGLLAPMTSVIAMACGPGGPVGGTFSTLLAVMAAVIAMACGSASSGGPAGGTFSTLLAHIPDTPETRREVSINDFARLRELFDIPLPDAGADRDELIEYLNEHLGPVGAGVHLGLADSPWISGYTGNWEGEQYTLENLAFGIHNVDQSVLAGPPPGRLEIVEGLFDPEATERALENCQECPPPERIKHQGIEFYSWGQDLAISLEHRLAPPAFDPLGRGGRIAVLGLLRLPHCGDAGNEGPY